MPFCQASYEPSKHALGGNGNKVVGGGGHQIARHGHGAGGVAVLVWAGPQVSKQDPNTTATKALRLFVADATGLANKSASTDWALIQ